MSRPKKQPFPERVKPMLATPSRDPFTDPDWLYEIKWDGYRIIAQIRDGKPTLFSREGQDYTKKFKAVADELNGMPDCILDGEVVLLNDKGHPDFNGLRSYAGQGDLVYYIFDLLFYDGVNYMSHPLLERKEMLLHVINKENILTYSDHFDDGIEMFKMIQSLNLEGMIAKHKESAYLPGRRSQNWLKIKVNVRQEYVIGGWASDNDKTFKTILLGQYVNGRLKYIHHSGGGYTNKIRKELFEKMKSFEVSKCPFFNPKDIDVDTQSFWCKPVLVGEFEQSNLVTKSGHIRHPVNFKGLREDKKPKDVVPEII